MVRSKSIALSFTLLFLAVSCSAPRVERVRDIEGFRLTAPVAASSSSTSETADALPWTATGSSVVSEVETALPTSLSFHASEVAEPTPVAPATLNLDDSFEDTDRGGFLYGEQHFKSKPRPLDSPLYFESPFVNTEVRPIFMVHELPEELPTGDAHVIVAAVQARVALTEQLQFIVTEDGVSFIDTEAFGKTEGWNDITAGLKYAFLADKDNNLMAAGGLRFQGNTGSRDVLQGATDELSGFLTVYKGLGDRTNMIADVNYRFPLDHHDGNQILSWDVHFDFEAATGLFPLFELHGLHYLTNGNRLPFNFGGLDYANIGSARVAGSHVFWATFGLRWQVIDQVSLGIGYSVPLEEAESSDIMESRFILDAILRL